MRAVVAEPLDDRRAPRVIPPGSARTATHRGGRRSGRILRRVAFHILVIIAFALPAVALWWHAWDGHLSSTLTCACGDSGQTVWFVAWPAYALAHGLDPFFSGALQAPYGANLLANASSVPIGVLLAPVTLTAGPIAATNVALTLCPALSAWACWIAARHLVAWRPAAVVAGILFGYSPFVVTNLAVGHLGLALLVAPPLLLVATHHVLFGTSAKRTRWSVALGALLVLQFFLSSEVLAIVVVVGVPCTVVGAIVRRGDLAPPRELVPALGAAGLVVVLLLALPLWFFLSGPQHLRGPLWTVQGNVLNWFWDPGRYRASARLLRLGGYEGSAGPPSSYLGPVVLALSAASLAVAWRRRAAWLLALTGAVAAVCSLGAFFWPVPGHLSNLWLPWRVVASWPLLDDVIPQRFSLVVDLSVALLIAVGIDAARRAVLGRRRAGGWHAGTATCSIVAAAVALGAASSLWTTYQTPLVTRSVRLPAWYTEAAPRLPAGTVVLSYPFPFPLDGSSAPMVWQAVDGMRFRLAGGYLKEPAPDGRPLSDRPVRSPYDVLGPLTSSAAGRRLPEVGDRELDAVRTALIRWRVDDVVVVSRGRDPAGAVRLFSLAIRRPPRKEFGAWIWRLRTR